MSIKTKLKAGCGVITIFGMGFVLGAVFLLILIVVNVTLEEGWKTEASKKHIADQLANQLKMTEEQREQVRPIVNEFLDRSWDLRRDYLKESERLREEKYLPQVDELLTDEQKEKLQKVQEKWRRKYQDAMEEPAEEPAEE